MERRFADERHKDFYRNHLQFLTENIRITHILSKLFSERLISMREREELDRSCDRYGNTTTTEKLIMEILWRKPCVDSLARLVRVLRLTEHDEVANYIEFYFPEFKETAAGSASLPPYEAQCPSYNTAVYQPQSGYHAQAAVNQTSVTQFAKSDSIPPTTTTTPYADPDHSDMARGDYKLTQEELFVFTNKVTKYVCHLVWPNGKATGFVLGCITDRQQYAIMTNCHVLNLMKQYLNADHELCAVKAHFQLDSRTIYQVLLTDVVLCEDQALDYAMLQLQFDEQLYTTFGDCNSLAKFIPNQLNAGPEYHPVLVLIGHPTGHEKTIDRAEVKYQAEQANLPGRVHYICSSHHGSSGAPCFDVQAKRLHCMQCGGNNNIQNGVQLYLVVKDIQCKMRNNIPQCRLQENQFEMLFPSFRQ